MATGSQNKETSSIDFEMNSNKRLYKNASSETADYKKAADYRPMVPPTRLATDLNVVRPAGKMADKHAASAPYHIFYTTITDAEETHSQEYSITFLEILDPSLGELKCSLQLTFLLDLDWLLEQYRFAGYSQKKMTVLHGEKGKDLTTISVEPHVEVHEVSMPSDFGLHHTKMMVLCYEDGSLRVVISTANIHPVDWQNWTQGLWFSPRCPELAPDSLPRAGESPTKFKRSLLLYLSQYDLPSLSYYLERVKRCDFSHINVFLVASVPGSHTNWACDWGMTRAGSLLRKHCLIPAEEAQKWPLLAQSSSIGGYGPHPKLWLRGAFLDNFTKTKSQAQMPSTSASPELKLIYPSLENVQQSHDGLLGGRWLPYEAELHCKQSWLNNFLYQWKATSTNRNRAMPHIKSYTRVSPDHKMAAFYLLTSANVSKSAWGTIWKDNPYLGLNSYEAGVLFLPKFVINEEFFPLDESAPNRLILAYDIPPTKYTKEMSPWVIDHLREQPDPKNLPDLP